MSDVIAIVALILAAGGCALLLLAGVGVVRMPDSYMRMQTASKATTLGAICVLGATAMAIDDGAAAVRAVLALVFLATTTPVAAHLLARVAAQRGVPFAPETKIIDTPPTALSAAEDVDAEVTGVVDGAENDEGRNGG